jgi:steroid 5-alpha reductase family enzyme
MISVLIPLVSIGLSLVMTAAWMLQRRMKNGGWVDVVWSFGLGAAGLIYAFVPAPGGAGLNTRQIIVGILIGAWSLRLGFHLADRTRRGPEDVRYAQFRKDWGASFERRMFWFLQIQALAAALLALSVLLAARNPAPLGPGDLAGLVVLCIALSGEALADMQLRRFRNDPANHGRVCDDGLWGWSRHPNYFFQWLGWLAYPLFAIDLYSGYGWGWLAFAAPVLMYVLLVYISGIPPLEQQMLRTRGDAYRAYQARTRAFLPWPKARPT